MARDECRDCEQTFPGGEELVDGRCPACLALLEERQREAKAKPQAVREEKEE